MFRFLAERYPRVTSAFDLEAMRAIRLRMATEHPHMGHDFTFLRIAALEFHASEAGYPTTMAQEAFDVFFRARNQVDLFEDVRPALMRLQARFDLYSISNGNADPTVIGIAEHFRGHVAARDAGALKPDPRIFRHLVELAGVAPDQILHVGDDPDADVDGARAAGIQVAWLNRQGAAWPAARSAPALSLRSLDDLLQALNF